MKCEGGRLGGGDRPLLTPLPALLSTADVQDAARRRPLSPLVIAPRAVKAQTTQAKSRPPRSVGLLRRPPALRCWRRRRTTHDARRSRPAPGGPDKNAKHATRLLCRNTPSLAPRVSSPVITPFWGGLGPTPFLRSRTAERDRGRPPPPRRPTSRARRSSLWAATWPAGRPG